MKFSEEVLHLIKDNFPENIFYMKNWIKYIYMYILDIK